MTYTPQPVSTEDMELSSEILQLTEQVAANVHEVWAAGRIAEGWQYGQIHNYELKRHPCLVPYDELPESEKEYDRKTAMETLKLLHKLGFKISGELRVEN